MRRKLIKQGMGGLTVSVPKKWADRKGLQARDEVEIVEEGADLLIKGAGSLQKNIELTIDEENLGRIRTIVASAYREGYDQIILQFKREYPLSEINKIVESLTGFIIIEQTPNRVVMKSVMAKDAENVSAIINKMFVSAQYTIYSTIEMLEKNEDKTAEIDSMHETLLKLRDYAQRSICITKYEGDKSYEYYVVVFLLEKFAGKARDALLSLKSMDRPTRLIVAEYLRECEKALRGLNTALSSKDLELALKINKALQKRRYGLLFDRDYPAYCGMAMESLYPLSARIVGVLI